jgi:site-specific DNA-methyltransferase (adenine-specific)
MAQQQNPALNQLFYGDNLAVLREYIPDQSVDLIYLDPPFNSRQDYNVLFDRKINESRKIDAGARSASQITAFKDTWEWNEESSLAYEQVVETGGRVAEAMRAFRTLLGGTDMLAYLAMMAPRKTSLSGNGAAHFPAYDMILAVSIIPFQSRTRITCAH